MAIIGTQYILTANKKQSEIRIRIFIHEVINTKVKTGIVINPAYWLATKQQASEKLEYPEAAKINKKLRDLRKHIQDSYLAEPDKSNKTINAEWINTVIDKFHNPAKYAPKKQRIPTLFEFIQSFIDNAHTRKNADEHPITKSVIDAYKVTLKHLQNFADKRKDFEFSEIGEDFYTEFKDYLSSIPLKPNTQGKQIKNLKVFLKEASKLKYKYLDRKQFESFAVYNKPAEDNIYLTKDELTQFYNYDFSSNKRLERVRDLFIVGAWTGLRFSDWPKVNYENISGNFLTLFQQKTRGKVIIPLHYTVSEILTKYDGKLPEALSNQKFNEYLKEAAKLAGINQITICMDGTHLYKYESICTHTARRTFCTNAYKDGIPTLAIMAISGHKTESAFLRYIKADKEEHATKIFDVWNKNGEFLRIAK